MLALLGSGGECHQSGQPQLGEGECPASELEDAPAAKVLSVKPAQTLAMRLEPSRRQLAGRRALEAQKPAKLPRVSNARTQAQEPASDRHRAPPVRKQAKPLLGPIGARRFRGTLSGPGLQRHRAEPDPPPQ